MMMIGVGLEGARKYKNLSYIRKNKEDGRIVAWKSWET